MTSICCQSNGLTMDHSMPEQVTVSGTTYTKTSNCHCDSRQTYKNMTEPIVKNWTVIHRTGGENPTKVKSRQKTSDWQLCKICDLETDKLKINGPLLMTSSRQPLSSLFSRCKRLEEENASMLRQILEIEEEAMKSATEHLQQYDRAGSNVRAVQIWTEHQIQDAQQDLELTRERREGFVNDLRLQLQNCEEKIKEVQKDLQELREYRDRGHSVKVLLAAELERELCVLTELHQDQTADVEALAQTEIENLLESHQKLKDGVLQTVVEQRLESLPLSLKRMHFQNQEMKSEIKAYQQMITGLQDDIKKLLETGNSLCKSWKEETDRRCRELLLSMPSCPADEDVLLDIPLNKPMYI
ncbi:uncharacterized protein C20orf96 homolog [Leptodactylus fuscus]|uniref:uncharacterized protein C20orf96 homolog n=1 Tax=Leptodactylus fuscus TaxID=238119 RepID=UPI003F4E8516